MCVETHCEAPNPGQTSLDPARGPCGRPRGRKSRVGPAPSVSRRGTSGRGGHPRWGLGLRGLRRRGSSAPSGGGYGARPKRSFPLQFPTWQAGFIDMDKKSTHTSPEDAGNSRNGDKHKQKKKKQNQKHRQSRHRSSTSYSSDDCVFPSSSSSSGSQTDSSTEDATKGKIRERREKRSK